MTDRYGVVAIVDIIPGLHAGRRQYLGAALRAGKRDFGDGGRSGFADRLILGKFAGDPALVAFVRILGGIGLSAKGDQGGKGDGGR